MGLSKVVAKGNSKVVFVHQVGVDGKAYAEDITVELQPGVDPSRLAYWVNLDGKVGVASFSFTAYDQEFSGQMFPEAR